VYSIQQYTVEDEQYKSLCLIVESVFGEIRSGGTERDMLPSLGNVWIKCLRGCPLYSWMNVRRRITSYRLRLARQSVKTYLIGRRS
jgi:hypothetical protein